MPKALLAVEAAKKVSQSDKGPGGRVIAGQMTCKPNLM
jgi:hypothetical protein